MTAKASKPDDAKRSRSLATEQASDQVAGLARQIGKRRPFASPAQEACLNLVRTAAVFESDFHQLFRQHGISAPAYNVLRILRGSKSDPAAPHGRTCSQVGEHLITHVPDVTRLVDRLEEQGLAGRERCTQDRRVVYVTITPKGEALLARLDQPVLELHQRHMGHMTKAELSELSRLLTKARSAVEPSASERPVRAGKPVPSKPREPGR